MKPSRQHLIGKYGRGHINIKNIMYWARCDYGYPLIQLWELEAYVKDTFIVHQVMQSKIVRSLCAKV
jgi:hypothetical protein